MHNNIYMQLSPVRQETEWDYNSDLDDLEEEVKMYTINICVLAIMTKLYGIVFTIRWSGYQANPTHR